MTPRDRARALLGDGVRFLAAGGLNTLLTLGVYQLLLFVAPDWLAYAASWVAGLAFVTSVYPDRVFVGGRRDRAARLQLAATYATLFVLGLGTLRALGWLGVPPRLSILLVIGVTTLGNFVLGRAILTGKRP